MITLSYEYKLVPTPNQAAIIEQTLNVCRKVWNFALRERKDWSNSRKSEVNACSVICEYIIPTDAPYPNYHKQAKSLTQAKKTCPELKDINAQVRKDLSVRVHHCPECGYTTDRDVASAQVIRERGITAGGLAVAENVCVGEAAGIEVTQSSWHLLRQKTFEAIQGNPLP